MEDAAPVAPLTYPFDAPPPEREVIDVAPGVLWARIPLPMHLDHVNVYILDDGNGWTVVDTGLNTKRTIAIWQELLDGPLAGKPVRRVIGTHHHPDHIGLAGWFQTVQGAELVMTRTAWLMARMLTLDEQPLPPPELLAYWRGAGVPAGLLAERAKTRPFNFADIVHPLPLGFTRIVEGDTITAGGRDWQVRIGHGHAPAHATLWSDRDHLVLAGDQLLSTISPNIGVYATEPGADPVGDWLESCERFTAFAADENLVLPGHKLPFQGLPARMRQLIGNHHGALDRLRAHLSQPRVAVDCFEPLFKRKIDEGAYGLALVESVAHLNHLLKLGEVTREMRTDGAWLWRLV